MAARSANVVARVEPSVKEQAESVMAQLGIPVSVVINMLYRQIALTQSIPFSLSLPARPISLEEMSVDDFNAMMAAGLADAKADNSRPISDVFTELRQELR